jgi:hypothetical protein
MITATTTNRNGRRILIIGLDKDKLQRLRSDPVYVDLTKDSMRQMYDDVLVLAGKTDGEIAEAVSKYFSPGA